MISSRYITKIVAALMAAAVLLCLAAMRYADRLTAMGGGTAVVMEYPQTLFDTSRLIEIDIQIEDEDWENMLQNAIAEEYSRCDVVINGTTICSVGIRPKGNTSLTSIASDPDTDRYSFKLEFDRYVEGQTCFGLDKLVLNNNYADATNMKEAIVYDMYQFLGVDASLYNYAKVSVNGEYWGVYLALEAVEESFMLRNYGTENGKLYKPESMGEDGGRGSMPQALAGNEMPEMPDGNEMPQAPDGNEMPQAPDGNEMPQAPEGSETPQAPEDNETPQRQGKMGRGFLEHAEGAASQTPMDPGRQKGKMTGGKGADLNYTDDNLDSYSTIWDGAVTDTGEKDHRKVVDALKNIGEGNDLESYLDIDNLVKYMAVHTFVVNLDSLSGNMAHNYYLYEADGKLNLLPWDYNLSFGAMSFGRDQNSASETINFPVDTPFSGTEFFNALLEQEEYLEAYHTCLKRLTEEYVKGGVFEKSYYRIRSQIDSLVKTDPTAFYSYEEYSEGADMLYRVMMLRTESVNGQLDGSIPSTSEGQKENPSALTAAEAIDIAVTGGMNRDKAHASLKERPQEAQNEPPENGFTEGERKNGEAGNHPGIYAGCLCVMLAALFCAGHYKRKAVKNKGFFA